MKPQSRFADFYPEHYSLLTNQTTRVETQIAFYALERFPKFRSVAAFLSAGLHTNDVIFIEKLTTSVEIAIRKFIVSGCLNRVLIRSEQLGGGLGSPSIQGVPIEKIFLEVTQLLASKPNLLVAVQSAGNIFRNFYNINWCIGGKFCRDILEVNGPGFTASDLNRYGIVHEGISIPSFINHLLPGLVERYFLVTQDIYSKNRQSKIDRYGENLLLEENSPLITQDHYQPVSIPLLQEIWNQRDSIVWVMEQLGYLDSGAVISLSFLPTTQDITRIHYWDVHRL